MSESRRDAGRVGVALVLSVATHMALTLVAGQPQRGDGPTRSPVPSVALSEVDIELPTLARVEAHTAARTPPKHAPRAAPPQRGGSSEPRPDSDRAGRGGDDEVKQPAINLAPRDDEAHLVPALRSRIDRAQQARTNNGLERRSPEDDRVTPRPMLLTFEADGWGSRADQRHPSDVVLPSAATLPAEAARSPRSGEAEFAWLDRIGIFDESAAAGDREGVHAVDHPAGGSGRVARRAVDGVEDADVARARPHAIKGDDSSPSDERGAQRDDVDAEQEVVAREPSMLRASTAGGTQGVGRGGSRGKGRTGSGGTEGRGSRSRALGDGSGQGVVANPADARRRTYIRGMWGKIDGQWDANRDVPRWAKLSFKQPYTIVSFDVQASGRVSNVRVTRSSGIPAFDARMQAAVRRAAPFGTLPRELGPVLRHQHPFMVSNPVVRPPHR